MRSVSELVDMGLEVATSDTGGGGALAVLGAAVAGAAALGAVSAMFAGTGPGGEPVYDINPNVDADRIESDELVFPYNKTGIEWVIGPESRHPERLADLPTNHLDALGDAIDKEQARIWCLLRMEGPRWGSPRPDQDAMLRDYTRTKSLEGLKWAQAEVRDARHSRYLGRLGAGVR